MQIDTDPTRLELVVADAAEMDDPAYKLRVQINDQVFVGLPVAAEPVEVGGADPVQACDRGARTSHRYWV